jgi:Tol biopolymer transport system component
VSKEIGYRSLGNIGWNPDGTCVTYDTYETSSGIEGEVPGLFVFDLRTSSVRRIADGFHPAWSPSGEWIAYLDGLNRIAVITPVGTNHRMVLSSNHRFGFAPVWSSDSIKLIANELVNEDKFTFDLHLFNLLTNRDEKIRRATTPVFGWAQEPLLH